MSGSDPHILVGFCLCRVYDADIKTTQFCGFEDVHSGFRDKLMAMLKSCQAAISNMACR